MELAFATPVKKGLKSQLRLNRQEWFDGSVEALHLGLLVRNPMLLTVYYSGENFCNSL